MNRRSFLKIAGGGIILAAGAGMGFALTRSPSQALAPWTDAGTARYADPRLHALSHAILAPTPHNQQPWKVALEGTDTAVLYFDLDRQLPETDPFDRQLTIGLGCFLELMAMAANANGHRVETELFPEGFAPEGLDNRPIARIRFAPEAGLTHDPLWAQVPHRRSLKTPYDTERPVPNDALAAIQAAGNAVHRTGGTTAPDDLAFLRQLTGDALVIELETPRTHHESVDLFRIGRAEINANPDGVSFSGPLFEAANRLGIFTREAAGDPTSSIFRQSIDMVLANAHSGMGYVWLVSDSNSRLDQIEAGRAWLRMNLAATGIGIGMQPMSQALQEYPEMADLYTRTHQRLAPEGGTVQMLARIGYGSEVPVSPRWPLEAKMVSR